MTNGSLDNATRDGKLNEMLAFYDDLYARLAESRTFGQVMREALGNDFNAKTVQFSFGGRKEFEGYLLLARSQAVRRVLELGCGYGGLCISLAETLPIHATGIDISEVAIKYAKRCSIHRSLVGVVKFVVADMNALRFERDSLDAVFAVDAFHHSSAHQCVPKLSSWLRSGGIFQFTTWLDNSESNLRQNSFCELKRYGFEITKVKVTLEEMGYQARIYDLTYKYREDLCRELGNDFVCLMLREALHLSSRDINRCMVTAFRR